MRQATRRLVVGGLVLALPLAGLVLLLAVPSLDREWDHQPSHFWLVLVASATNAVLAYATGDAARRRRDARMFLISLSFLAAGGFLFLHALSTPGVLIDHPNAGFVIATPVGLTLCAIGFASAARRRSMPSEAVMGALSRGRSVLVAAFVAWAVVSLAKLPPLDEAPLERGAVLLVALAAIGLVSYVVATVSFISVYRQRPSPLLASVIAACILLAEAMLAVALSRSWHASWWEWHVLMLVAFAVVAQTARVQWRDERFAGLYLEETAAGAREVSVLFADLQGFTSFSETHDAREVSEMLNAFFDVAVPSIVGPHGGSVDRLIGDAVMATFNANGDQPDHPKRAAASALHLRDAAAALAAEHPDWPRLRIGVNSGEAAVGVLGTSGGRTYTVVGDTVNVASRLEALAPAGGIVVSAATLAGVPGARVESLGAVQVKGRTAPVEAFVLLDLAEH